MLSSSSSFAIRLPRPKPCPGLRVSRACCLPGRAQHGRSSSRHSPHASAPGEHPFPREDSSPTGQAHPPPPYPPREPQHHHNHHESEAESMHRSNQISGLICFSCFLLTIPYTLHHPAALLALPIAFVAPFTGDALRPMALEAFSALRAGSRWYSSHKPREEHVNHDHHQHSQSGSESSDDNDRSSSHGGPHSHNNPRSRVRRSSSLDNPHHHPHHSHHLPGQQHHPQEHGAFPNIFGGRTATHGHGGTSLHPHQRVHVFLEDPPPEMRQETCPPPDLHPSTPAQPGVLQNLPSHGPSSQPPPMQGYPVGDATSATPSHGFMAGMASACGSMDGFDEPHRYRHKHVLNNVGHIQPASHLHPTPSPPPMPFSNTPVAGPVQRDGPLQQTVGGPQGFDPRLTPASHSNTGNTGNTGFPVSSNHVADFSPPAIHQAQYTDGHQWEQVHSAGRASQQWYGPQHHPHSSAAPVQSNLPGVEANDQVLQIKSRAARDGNLIGPLNDHILSNEDSAKTFVRDSLTYPSRSDTWTVPSESTSQASHTAASHHINMEGEQVGQFPSMPVKPLVDPTQISFQPHTPGQSEEDEVRNRHQPSMESPSPATLLDIDMDKEWS